MSGTQGVFKYGHLLEGSLVHQVLELIEALGPVLAAALVDLFGELLVVVDAEGDPLGVLVLNA